MRTRSARAAAAAAGGDDAGTDGVPDKVRSANAFAEGDNASENEDISDHEKSGNKGAEEDSGGEEEEASSGSEEEAADEEDDAADVSGTNDQKWQAFYDQLKKQYGEVGHCRVKQKFEMKQGKKKQVYQPLAAFVKRQRALHSAGKLKSHRVELLKAINFAFDHKKETWMEKLDQLKLYKMHKSHCKVTNKDGKDYDGLPNFVRIQRAEWRKMRNGKKSAMTQDRLELLEEIGFDFNPFNIAITDEEKEAAKAKTSAHTTKAAAKAKKRDKESKNKAAKKKVAPADPRAGSVSTASFDAGSKVKASTKKAKKKVKRSKNIPASTPASAASDSLAAKKSVRSEAASTNAARATTRNPSKGQKSSNGEKRKSQSRSAGTTKKAKRNADGTVYIERRRSGRRSAN